METKVCRKEYLAEWRQQNKEKIKEYNAQYFLENKEKIKKYKAKYKAKYKQQNKEYRKKNKEKIKEYQAEYFLENKEKIKEYQAEYFLENKKEIKEYQKNYLQTERGKAKIARANHKRRELEKKAEISLTHEQWSAILGLQQYKCACCGQYFDSVAPERDHVIPLTRGGGLTFLNTQALCRSCNSKKNNKIIDYRTNNHKTTIRVLTNGN